MQRTKTDQARLTDRQIKALPHLIGPSSDIEACRQAKIAKDTYYTWLKKPIFRAELQRIRDLVVHDAVETLKASTTKAIETLVNLLDTPNPGLQRQVANDVLGHVARFQELKDLEKRLSLLEEQQGN